MHKEQKNMVNEKPNVKATNRYNVQEACKILGITRKTLLKYTNNGLIECGVRKATNRKFYTGLSLQTFWSQQF